MSKKIRVLYIGDTQVDSITSAKGIDNWTYSYYDDSAIYLREALKKADDIECVHMPSAQCIADAPSTLEEWQQYDVVIVSDLGYNNLALQPGNNAEHCPVPMGPDRVGGLCEFVRQGGGFMMIGGWLSFSGLQGKAIYGGTRIEKIMPVNCLPNGADDRLEITWGYDMKLDDPDHPIVKGLPWDVPYLMLGYNKTVLKEEAHLVASYDGDPQIATMEVGKGRTSIFASDVGPHWAGSFLEWPGYTEFWCRMCRWLAGTI